MANVTMHKTYTFGQLHKNRQDVSFFTAPFASIVQKLIMWQDRLSERASLRDADAHLLQDMGITAQAAYQEACKPFWVS
ncbi:hypothetical protein WH95_13110 [Kiloniella litopenaei]|uniref:DUF1127 domain-containing protein n=1 Tax=Kiloniella litopenaei TaxID=1549748 RepID=A0A0M2R9Y8_9PROT|nr:hypothetical protein [Kiloniella litopenaei]KKJ76418.1 hypothetical protein WH95_13110 [Kiloniella litopenaei]